jgi:hypothetical protein
MGKIGNTPLFPTPYSLFPSAPPASSTVKTARLRFLRLFVAIPPQTEVTSPFSSPTVNISFARSRTAGAILRSVLVT